jgi:hypothetical protein
MLFSLARDLKAEAGLQEQRGSVFHVVNILVPVKITDNGEEVVGPCSKLY